MDFQAQILKVINTNGWDHISAASYPAPPTDEIVGFYRVPVSDGPAGYRTKYGDDRLI